MQLKFYIFVCFGAVSAFSMLGDVTSDAKPSVFRVGYGNAELKQSKFSADSWALGPIVVPPKTKLDWPKKREGLNWPSVTVRDVFIDVRRPLPQPLPGSKSASPWGSLPTQEYLGLVKKNSEGKQTTAQARFNQMRFWEVRGNSFPSILSVVNVGKTGYVSWNNGKRQLVGDTSIFKLPILAKGVEGGRGGGMDGDVAVEVSLVCILDGYLIVTLNSIGPEYFLPSERVYWALPWSWLGYLSNSQADYHRATGSSILLALSKRLSGNVVVPNIPGKSSGVTDASGNGSFFGGSTGSNVSIVTSVSGGKTGGGEISRDPVVKTSAVKNVQNNIVEKKVLPVGTATSDATLDGGNDNILP